MILGFKTKLPNGTPTYFPEKIIEGLMKNCWIKVNDWTDIMLKEGPQKEMILGQHKPKVHTLRTDDTDRWHKDVMIDFFTGVRTKQSHRFAPRVPVISTQSVKIDEMIMTSADSCYKLLDGRVFVVRVDGRKLKKSEIFSLAKNDGFDSPEDFFKWFHDGWKGKIIHWTCLKY